MECTQPKKRNEKKCEVRADECLQQFMNCRQD
jgi:hypothetical protein